VNSAMDWNGMRVFLAIARAGSLRAASQQLGVSHSTISRRLAALEEQLDVRLFDAMPEGYRLTAAGTRILELAEQVEEGMFGIERMISGVDQRVDGRVRLTLPLPMYLHLLAAPLADFAQQWPGIELDIDTNLNLLDLSRREADVAVRVLMDGKSPPDDLIGRHIGHLPRAVYASQAYLEAHDPLDPASDACWIGWSEQEPHPDWIVSGPLPALSARHGLNDPLAQLAGARAGLGLTMLPILMGDAAEGVIRVPGLPELPGYEIWMLSHPDLRDTARVRAVKGFLLEVFDDLRDVLRRPEYVEPTPQVATPVDA